MSVPKEDITNMFMNHVRNVLSTENDTINGLDKAIHKSLQTRKRIQELYENIKQLPPGESHDTFANGISRDNLDAKCFLLLPDMKENYELNIEETINKLKAYLEKTKSSYEKSTLTVDILTPQVLTNLDIDAYESSLNLLRQHCNRFSFTKTGVDSERNLETAELNKLIHYSDLFINMVKAQETLATCDNNWMSKNHTDFDKTFNYCEVIDEILSKCNQLTCSLHDKQDTYFK